MKKAFYFIGILFGFLPLKTPAQTRNNAVLQKMYDEDQAARMAANIDWAVVGKQDSLRELAVCKLLREGKVITGRDHYNAAMIFQHGEDTTASAMAVRQMRKAVALDTTIDKWLLAAAIDRDLMYRNKPQIYGTQYTKKDSLSKWERYRIDTTQVTDRERTAYGVETLAEQKIKERLMNLASLMSYYTTHSLDQATALINTERQKGDRLQYDVTEGGINNFGYELMAAGKMQDALAIFQLNTRFYPDSYNTFDSYGECLLKLGDTKEGLAAYRKSLELNPKNENARAVLMAQKETR